MYVIIFISPASGIQDKQSEPNILSKANGSSQDGLKQMMKFFKQVNYTSKFLTLSLWGLNVPLNISETRPRPVSNIRLSADLKEPWCLNISQGKYHNVMQR